MRPFVARVPTTYCTLMIKLTILQAFVKANSSLELRTEVTT
jgi:hypothetical protein